MWVEVNSRVNYPLKEALNYLAQNGVIDLEDDIEKFAVSFVAIMAARHGIQSFVSAEFQEKASPWS